MVRTLCRIKNVAENVLHFNFTSLKFVEKVASAISFADECVLPVKNELGILKNCVKKS